MATVAGAPAGYRGTRGEILIALKKAQPLTAKQLADRLGVTPNALRRHLKELDGEGIVRYQREIRGVGGPVFAFSLTEAGERLPVEQRATRLAELLTSLGYMAEARSVAGALPVLTEHNCAIRLIAERFPEVCAAEERFIADLLGAPVTRQAHIAKGANCCEYCITRDSELQQT
jgi:DeoR family suf operon transcriptional repressor